MKPTKFLSLFLLSIFLISLASAISTDPATSLGVYKQNEPLDLIQLCNNKTSICDSCNLSTVKLPNSTTLIENVLMTKRIEYFNFTLNSGQTDTLGEYLVNGNCHGGTEITNFVYTVRVNKTGEELSTSQGIIYVVFLIAAIFFFIMSFFVTIKIPWTHQRNQEGKIVSINDLKFVKIFLIGITYTMLMFIFGILYNVTDSFLFLTSASLFFYWFFWIMLSYIL